MGAYLHACRELLVLEMLLLQAQEVQDPTDDGLWALHKLLEVDEHHAVSRQENDIPASDWATRHLQASIRWCLSFPAHGAWLPGLTSTILCIMKRAGQL